MAFLQYFWYATTVLEHEATVAQVVFDTIFVTIIRPVWCGSAFRSVNGFQITSTILDAACIIFRNTRIRRFADFHTGGIIIKFNPVASYGVGHFFG
jgi:hypothetical protein